MDFLEYDWNKCFRSVEMFYSLYFILSPEDANLANGTYNEH